MGTTALWTPTGADDSRRGKGVGRCLPSATATTRIEEKLQKREQRIFGTLPVGPKPLVTSRCD
jgi:hypothetical protein